jgi:transcriptional regulator with XRE-family HTH domain
MPAPYNYMAMIPRPDLAKSVQAGAALGEAIGGAVQAGRQREQEEMFQTDLQSALKNPTFGSFRDLMTKYPSQAANIAKLTETMDDAERKSNYDTGLDIYTALEGGYGSTAIKLMDEQIAAGKNAGVDTRRLEEIRGQMQTNPQAAKAGLGLWLSGTDPKRWGEAATAFEIRAKSKAEREKEEISVKKLGEEIGLTRAQVKQAEAAAAASRAAEKKSGAEAEKAKAEADRIALGIIPEEKRPEAESKLRKEYIDNTKDFSSIRDAYGKIVSVSDPKTPDEEGPSDLALIFSYMKMLDPGSVVREGEFATAQNAAGVPDRIRNQFNNLQTGGRLNPEQRKSFRRQAEKLYDVSAKREQEVRTGLSRIGKGYGLNLENVFYSPGGVEKPMPPAERAAQPTNPTVNVPAGSPLSNAMDIYGGRK